MPDRANPDRTHIERLAPVEEPPRYATRNWQAEAWQRERERTLRSGEHRAGIAMRRVSQG